MADRHGYGGGGGSVRQMPCPDCGSPVRPESDQLCPNCGYPLMFLRQETKEEEPRAVPRMPGEPVEQTGMAPRLNSTRQYPPATYGNQQQQAPPPQGRELACPGCGYPNEQTRVRCERCGRELRAARPNAVRLGPPPVESPRRRWLIVLLVILAILAVASIATALLTYFWDQITAAG